MTLEMSFFSPRRTYMQVYQPRSTWSDEDMVIGKTAKVPVNSKSFHFNGGKISGVPSQYFGEASLFLMEWCPWKVKCWDKFCRQRYQFGFRKNHSASFALIEAADTMYKHLDRLSQGFMFHSSQHRSFRRRSSQPISWRSRPTEETKPIAQQKQTT